MSEKQARLIDGDKLLGWIENNPNADGFWNGQKSIESFDSLTDAISLGELAPSNQGEVAKLRETLEELKKRIEGASNIAASALHFGEQIDVGLLFVELQEQHSKIVVALSSHTEE